MDPKIKAFFAVAGIVVAVLAVAGGGAWWLYQRAFATPELSIPAESTEEHRLAAIEIWLDNVHAAGKLNGGVLVLRDGEPLIMKTMGFADVAAKEAITPQSSFRLASVSKQFTAAGVLVLVAQEKLSLDTPLDTIIPELKFPGVTVRHLLNQTSGIPDVYMDLAQQYRDAFGEHLEVSEVVALLAKHPPQLREPGAAFSYSNTNYVLAAAVIERVSGQSFEAFMQEQLFTPLGMKNTRVWNLVSPEKDFPGKVADLALLGGRVEMTPSFIDGVAGDGAVFSSLEDLIIWDRFWYENELVPPELTSQAFVSPKLNDGTTSDYGFGWINVAGNGSAWHNGAWLGARTYVARSPNRGRLFIAVLDNSSTLAIDPIVQQLMVAVEPLIK
jgi:CubicO group peptidase (beta-lactamase class C family)